MKVEINRLTGRGIKVTYTHGRSLWEFAHCTPTSGRRSSHANGPSELLCQLTPLPHYCGHLSVVLQAAPDPATGRARLRFVERDNFLKLVPDYAHASPAVVVRCPGAEIELLLASKYHGKVYVSGIFVCSKRSQPSAAAPGSAAAASVGARAGALSAAAGFTLDGMGINYIGGRST
jgi:hypothetical protein